MIDRLAPDLYSYLVAVIDKAAADRNIYDVPKAAEQAGMEGGETARGLGQRWDYIFVDGSGQSVKLHCRWYDQSKAFSIQPDMHIMEIELVGGSTSLRHSARYEE